MMLSQIAREMIDFSQGNLHDIDHLLKVHAYARIIGQSEGLDPERQFALEAAALIHDIACPLCRKKYGNTNGKAQEREGEPLARDFLRRFDLPPELSERIVYLVAHHHSWGCADGPDYQILLEADYLVNAGESGYTAVNLQNALTRLFRTETGKALLRSVYRERLEAL